MHIASALSWSLSCVAMLNNLKKPVILTGSQLPIGDLRTDAKENLLTSLYYASLYIDNEAAIKEVALYFEYKLLRGNRCLKYSAENFDAFISVAPFRVKFNVANHRRAPLARPVNLPCYAFFITNVPAIMSCRPCFCFVNATIKKPTSKIIADMILDQYLALAFPKPILLPAISVTLRPNIFFPSVACQDEDSDTVK